MKKSIMKRAREFVDAPCDHKCKICKTDAISCRFYNDEQSFIAGAESEHTVLVKFCNRVIEVLDKKARNGCYGDPSWIGFQNGNGTEVGKDIEALIKRAKQIVK